MNSYHGRIIALSISRTKGIPKTNVDPVHLIEDWGIEDDVHGGKWHRQVSFLALESIEKIRAKGLKVRPGAFAENITTQFVDIPNLHAGDRIRIGETELEVTQIGKECHTRCAIYYKAGDCVMPREGVFAKVLKGGTIRVGDIVDVVPVEQTSMHRPGGEANPILRPYINPSLQH
ncbi:MAG: MOSC domain-containing protein [Bacteroidota bacterium]